MIYNYAESIKDLVIAELSQFQSDDSGSNMGVGFSGWDNALAYARAHDLDYFGSVFPATGDEEQPKAFGYGMWTWIIYIRFHIKFEKDVTPTPDQKAQELADDFMSMMLNRTNLDTIDASASIKVLSANYIGEPEYISDVTYLVQEFLIAVKSQIDRG